MPRYKKNIYTLILLSSFLLAGCDQKEKEPGKSLLITGDIQYDIHNPDKRFILPGVLQEISGIEILNDSIILCVEDERGRVYFYNQNQEAIVHELDFKEKGDFEGIALLDSIIYVLKSNGHLYHFPLSMDASVESESVNTRLKGKNDAEGLAIYSKKSLLVACKGKAGIEDNDLNGRAIYEYLIEDASLKDDPLIHLESKEFEKRLKELQLNPLKHMPFGPSGVAVHPATGDIFIIGSVGKLAIVIDKTGEITDMGTLKSSIYVQPEGICFDSLGNLYIASEGKKGKGYILKFYQQEISKEIIKSNNNGEPK
jgi:hypothetical protein